MTIPTVLTIAGSDPSGGAGIQGDIKTILAEGCYGMAAITGLTAQNTNGVSAVMPVPAEFLRKQIEEVIRDIRPDAIKVGMIVTTDQVDIIANVIKQYSLANVVVDPVAAPTIGVEFAGYEVMRCMVDKLFPLSTVITPNLPETEKIYEIIAKLEGKKRAVIKEQDQSHIEVQAEGYSLSAQELAKRIGKRCGCNVLVKGGHYRGKEATDCLWTSGSAKSAKQTYEFKDKMIETTSSHGTGCALSSSIAANLAKGYVLEQAVYRGKEYVTAALASDMHIGTGNGSVDHGALIR